KTAKIITYGATRTRPHACQGVRRLLRGPAGADWRLGSPAPPSASVDTCWPAFRSAGERLDARDHLGHRLVDRDLVVAATVHRLGPHVLVVDDRELVVLGEFEVHRARAELVVDRAAVRVVLPERALRRCRHDGES